MKVGRKNKVLHIITSLGDGGAEGVLVRLCLHNKKNRHAVVSLTDSGKYGSILSEAGVSVHCLDMNSGKPSLSIFFKLIRLIKAEQPDVVQTWMYHADFMGGLAARLAGVSRVFWGVRNSTLEKGKSKRSTILIARLCAVLSRWVPKKIVCCARDAMRVHAEIGYASPKLLLIPNGYELSRFKPDFKLREEFRNELAISQDEFLIGKVGRYDPQKDHLNLLQALAFVSAQKVKYRCLLVGKGMSPENECLVKLIEELGLQHNMILVGQRSDIPAVMNALDLHIMSSSYGEAFPNVVAEAMACGTPCISTIVGDTLEIIGDAQACCRPRDPKALAELISKMADEFQMSPILWQARKSAGMRRIAKNYSIQVMVDAYEACWFSKTRGVN